MTDERALPVVVEEGVGDGDVVGSVGYVEKPVVVVLVVVAIGAEIDVVDPDVLSDLDGDCVAAYDFGYGEVADYDVLYVLDGQGEAREDLMGY